MPSPSASVRPLLAPWFAGTLAVLVLVGLWQGHAYWEYSDGVYSLSARQLLDGQALYRDFAGAQPPTLFFLGAGALAIHDAPSAIRVAMAGFEAALSLLVLVTVWRLTGRRSAALVAAFVSLLTPWMLREHAQFLPETVAAPLVLGTVLAAARPRTAALGGVLAAVVVSLKIALVLPVLGAVLLGRRVRRGAAALGAAATVGLVLFLVLYGSAGWDNVVRAQRQAGYAPVGYVAGLWAQGGWNLLPLLVLAVPACLGRDRLQDPHLARSLFGAVAGALLLFLTLFKHGSYLTMMVVVEPLVLCLAASGVARWLEDRRRLRRRGRVVPLALGAAVALGVAQVASLLIAPDHPSLFTRPLARSGPGRMASSADVDRRVRAIRACAPGTAFGGPPYLAFRAHRRIAGDQPDQFLIRTSPVLSAFRAAADGERGTCAPSGR